MQIYLNSTCTTNKNKKRKNSGEEEEEEEKEEVSLNSLHFCRINGKRIKVTKKQRKAISACLLNSNNPTSDTRAAGDQPPNPSGGGGRPKRKGGRFDRYCDICEDWGHSRDWCYYNTVDRSPDAPPIPPGRTAKPKKSKVEASSLSVENLTPEVDR